MYKRTILALSRLGRKGLKPHLLFILDMGEIIELKNTDI